MKRFFTLCAMLFLSFLHALPVFAQGGSDPLIIDVNVEEADTGSSSVLDLGAVDTKNMAGGDALCWTESACKNQIERDGGTFSSELWDLNKEDCGASNLGYCYPPVFEYRLIVPFGQITSVKGIGGYVQALYSLTIVLATIGAVLTIMVAGLRWMVARGDAGAVGDAKGMIGNSLGTIVILLLVISLANIIDPSLKILAPLRTPLIKKADFIEPGSSCEELKLAGYGISIPKGTCGNKAKITALPPVAENQSLISALQVGDDCIFASCNVKNLESCAMVGGDYECVRCGNVYAAPDVLTSEDLIPSPSTCGSLELSRTFATFPEEMKIKCLYFDAPRGNYNACVEVFYPHASAPGVDCDRLKQTYGEQCGMYNYVSVRGDGLSGFSYFSSLSSGSWAANLEGANGFDVFDAVCGGNICNLPTTCKTQWEDGSWMGGDGFIRNTAQCVSAN